MQALDDSEKEFVGRLLEIEDLDESFSSAMKLAAIAGFMSIGSLLPAASLTNELSKAKAVAAVTGKKFNIDSPLVKNAISTAAEDNKMVGEMSKTNVVNLVSQVLWKEARGEEAAGRKAIASVILNRCDNDPSNIVAVIKEPNAFSCMNGYAGGWTDKTYLWYVPAKAIAENPTNKAIWDECKSLALDLVD